MVVCSNEHLSLSRPTTCQTTDRTDGYSCIAVTHDQNPDVPEGCVEIVMYTLQDNIDLGEGAIFSLNYDVSMAAAEGQCADSVEIMAEGLQLFNSENQAIKATIETGQFCFGDEVTTTTTSPAGTTTTSPGGTTTTTTSPTDTTTTSPGDTTTTTTTSPGGESITISPDTLSKSHWIPLPFLLMIEGNETNFSAPNLFDSSSSASEVTFMPASAVLWFPPLVTDAEHIWQLVLVMPSWFTVEGDQPLNVTINTDGEIVSESILIEQLAF
jgi:hypothetical protein